MIVSIEAEHALLGAALYDNVAFDYCGEVRPEHFAEPLHARIWALMMEAKASGRMAEPIIVGSRLTGDAGFEELGGVRFLAELVNRAPPPRHAGDYAQQVVDAAKLRGICAVADEMKVSAESFADPEAVIAEGERGLAEISRTGGQPQFRSVGASALEMLERAKRGDTRGEPTGYAALDNVTGGIRPAEFWVIGGRASMGKSVVGLNLARGIAQSGRGVIIFSLEMTETEVQARMIADLAHDRSRYLNSYTANPRYGDILKGRGEGQTWDFAVAGAKALASLPIVINDTPGLTVDQIRSQAARQIRAWEKTGVKTGAIIVDHMGLLRPAQSRNGNTAAEMRDVSNGLKDAAKALRTPVIALAQINRDAEKSNDKRPTMAQLNWSGSIEQDAHFVGLLYREAYYLDRIVDRNEEQESELRRKRNDLEMGIQKNRNGPLTTLNFYCDVASNVVRDQEAA
jgi:replicative DNA helicase